MDQESKLLVLVYGITGSLSFLVGFTLSLMAQAKYMFIALLAGLGFGGLTYIITTNWPLGYMLGGLVVFFFGTGLGIYYFFTHFQIASSIPEDDSRIIRMTKVEDSTKIRQASGSW